jgi:hypothetical protein
MSLLLFLQNISLGTAIFGPLGVITLAPNRPAIGSRKANLGSILARRFSQEAIEGGAGKKLRHLFPARPAQLVFV